MKFNIGDLVKENITSKNNIGIIVQAKIDVYPYIVFLQSFIRNEEYGLYFFLEDELEKIL